MSPSDDDQLAQTEASERRLAFLRGLADHMVERLADGRMHWDAWLEHAGRHGRLGFTNTLLIPAQRPSATDVRPYDAWQEQQRQVRRGETGIRIMSTSGRPRTVFDIEQTDGEMVEKARCSPSEGLRRLSLLAADFGLYVDRGQGWTYLGRPDRRVQVAPELDDTTAATLLAHQLAHAVGAGGSDDTITMDSASCHGVRRVVADSVAYIVLTSLGLDASHLSFPPPRRWAGTDVRTDSAGAVRAIGGRITHTSGQLLRRLGNSAEATASSTEPANQQAHRPTAPKAKTAPRAQGDSVSPLRAALAEAHRFYRRNLPGSWGARYLADRGFSTDVQEQWEIGLSPRSRDALVRHLRELGHLDRTLIEAGLAKQREGGDLSDLFRERVLFPFRDLDGAIVGFIGRRRDGVGGPKYLNTPETALFHKSAVLFGLHEGRGRLAGRARPLLVEGPLDAIAVGVAMPEVYVAVATCGTAVTAEQVEAIAVHADLESAGLVIALDGDPAGRAGALRAWKAVRRITGPVEVAVLPQGQDPAEILSPPGQSAVSEALLSAIPLSDLLIDERIQRFGALEFAETRLAAAQAAAALIAELPPRHIARQVTRVADRTGMEPAEVTALVTAAISPDPSRDVSLPPLASPEQQDPPSRLASRTAAHKRTHRRTA
ncbi:toprim domain-containing protein [Actinomadura sp. NPDC048394]|jgi:DNA primase|uniref:toprim domain-containing protein n=1 Tax=Actinomadura sp. NPDC048394 TaxID=3158223 RepID=UPI003400D41A